jgi:acetylornithine deacetylase/succinyl-diaminopimelate desuccinylase-like protein
VAISTTEKVPRGMRLVAHGTAGHGSRPMPDNAITHLSAAVAKLGYWQPSMRLNETTRTYFERLARISSPVEAERYRRIADPQRAPAIDSYFRVHEAAHYSILRTSIVPTMLKAGFRSNVIPSEAEAWLDVRALPDEDIGRIVADLRKVIADPNVEIVPPRGDGRPAAPPSRLDTEMFRALEHTQRRMFPGAVTLPSLLTGATDMAQLRARGVQAYGYGPIADEADGEGGAHSTDERIEVESLEKLVQYLWYTVLEVAARQGR